MNRFPPKMPVDDLIEGFVDGLQEMIPEKLKEMILRQDELVEKRRLEYEIIDKCKPALDEASYYFWSLWFELEFGEYVVIERWLKYYLRLAEKVSENKDWILLDKEHGDLSESQIDTAKEFPLEDIFEGKLKKTGSHFVGLCPFHDEDNGSFTIFTNNNTYYCYGCGKWGDSIDLYRYYHKVDFSQVVRALQ